MLIYYSIIIFPFFLEYLAYNKTISNYGRLISYLWFSYLVYVIIVFGLSLRIGGDWNNYSTLFYLVHDVIYEIDQTWKYTPRVKYAVDYFDAPVFYLFNYITGAIYTNFIFFKLCNAIFFVYSINKFCSLFKKAKYLIFGFFMPYLGIVVSLGYLRQSLAISFLAISLYYFLRNKEIKSFLFMILSFLSHLVVAPYLLISTKSKKIKKFIFFSIVFIVLIILFIAFDKVVNYFYYYIGDGIHFTSKGAVARIMLNIPFFIIFYIYKFENKLSQNENFFFIVSFIILIICLILIFTGRFTIADRIGIQLILFQGYVIGKLYEHFNEVLIKKFYLFLVLSYSCIVFYGWKMLSDYSNDWFPYKNIILSIF